mmetsp:Transcript_60097/g.141461  ORF Transcript_60097/g.141461 Transcript_60097/m.141461 type:complete len:326 (-) Transcript_60097:215-1192(-)
MSYRPTPSDVNSNVRAPEERDRSSLLANADSHPTDEHPHVPPAVPMAAPDEIPTAEAAHIPAQMRMGGALEKSGFTRADTVPYSGGNWEIVGEDSQILVVKLGPGQELMVEPGGMMTKGTGTRPNVNMGNLSNGCKRCCCAGESCFRIIWQPADEDVVTVTPYFPSKVLPINLDQYAESGIFIKKKAWMASLSRETEFEAVLAPSLATACCAGQGVFMTLMRGSGMAFLNVGGTVVERVLEEGEELVLEQSSLVAWSPSVSMEVERVGSLRVICCGQQGLFNAVLRGPGRVLVQSMSFEKARAAYAAAAARRAPPGGVPLGGDLV